MNELWIHLWRAMLLATCFLIHKLYYKGWRALPGKNDQNSRHFISCIECLLYVHCITFSMLFYPLKSLMWKELPCPLHIWGSWDLERSIYLSEVVLLVSGTLELWFKCLTQKSVFYIIIPYFLSQELGVHEKQHWTRILNTLQ